MSNINVALVHSWRNYPVIYLKYCLKNCNDPVILVFVTFCAILLMYRFAHVSHYVVTLYRPKLDVIENLICGENATNVMSVVLKPSIFLLKRIMYFPCFVLKQGWLPFFMPLMYFFRKIIFNQMHLILSIGSIRMYKRLRIFTLISISLSPTVLKQLILLVVSSMVSSVVTVDMIISSSVETVSSLAEVTPANVDSVAKYTNEKVEWTWDSLPISM